MPTYAYRCADCGHSFDAVQSINDDALTTCPQCQGVLRKVYGSVGITFKGSGFYKTDSAKSRPGAKQGSDSTQGSGAKQGKSATDSGSTSSAGSSGSANSSANASASTGSGTD